MILSVCGCHLQSWAGGTLVTLEDGSQRLVLVGIDEANAVKIIAMARAK